MVSEINLLKSCIAHMRYDIDKLRYYEMVMIYVKNTNGEHENI